MTKIIEEKPVIGFILTATGASGGALTGTHLIPVYLGFMVVIIGLAASIITLRLKFKELAQFKKDAVAAKHKLNKYSP